MFAYFFFSKFARFHGPYPLQKFQTAETKEENQEKQKQTKAAWQQTKQQK